jgi:hypothetical protein
MNVAQHDRRVAFRALMIRAGQVLFLALVVFPVAMWCASLG